MINFLPVETWERVWGEEILLIHTNDYTGKLLKMKKGTRGGLQFHQIKNESQYLLSGKVLIEYDTGDGKLATMEWLPGMSIHIEPGTVHRETALEDSIIIEVSNPVFNDRVRVEEKYGETPDQGLPTTTIEDVEYGFPRRPYKEVFGV